jgi:hypothetical protein
MERVRTYPVTPPTIHRVPMTNAGTADCRCMTREWEGVDNPQLRGGPTMISERTIFLNVLRLFEKALKNQKGLVVVVLWERSVVEDV